MTRLELHEALCDFIGTRNVYFQPPNGMKLKFPAVVYRVVDKPAKRADNKNYLVSTIYNVTVITSDPDEASEKSDLFLAQFDTAKFLSQGVADGLYNTTFKITTTRRIPV